MTTSTERFATSSRSRPEAVPRQATPRDPDAPTDGAAAAAAARLLGRVMPRWARSAVDLLGEQEGGRYRYSVAVVTVPRQSAKTTTVLDIALGRGLALRDYRCAYAAQTGHVTTERFGDRFAEVALSPLAGRVKVRRSAGTERLTLPTGSYVKAFPPLDGALRSSALDFVAVDEGQEHADEPLGVALDHTIMPTFTTRPRRQFVILGTAPLIPGTYLERYVKLARAGAPGVALIDYGAGPDEDPGDPATWRLRHPGLADGLTDEAFLADQFTRDPDGFAREHLNVWPVGTPGAVIPADAWQAAQLPAMPPPGARIHLGVDVAPGSVHATVAAAWATDTGVHAAVVQSADGSSWLERALPDLVARWQPHTVAHDSVGTAAAVMARCRIPQASPEVFGDVAAGCSWLLEAITDGTARLTITPDEELDRAVAGAVRRTVGDTGRWCWGRRSSAGPIDPLVALTLAVWRAAAPPPEPFLR